MGVLTETKIRLRQEMAAWRQMRVDLQGDLVRQTDERRRRVSDLCAGFARDRAGAHRAWFGPAPSERHAAERHQQHRLAEQTRVALPAEEHPPASHKVEPHGHQPAKHEGAKHVSTPVAHVLQAQKPAFKGSRKH
jgi:hypothetical protein